MIPIIIHNKSVDNECTLQDREDVKGHLYLDIRFELFGFDLIVELDEHKHWVLIIVVMKEECIIYYEIRIALRIYSI